MAFRNRKRRSGIAFVYNVFLTVVLVLLLFSHSAIGQTVYRCVDEKNHVTFSTNPCPASDDTQKVIELIPRSKESERQALERHERSMEAIRAENEARREAEFRREARQVQDPVPPQNRPLYCPDVTLFSYLPYDSQYTITPEGEVFGFVNTDRCARIEFQLNGYGSQFNEREFTRKVAGYFIGVFADGQERGGRGLSIRTDRRVRFGEKYSGNLCFGNAAFPVVEIRCR